MRHDITHDGRNYSYYPYLENKDNLDQILPEFKAYRKSGYIDLKKDVDANVILNFLMKHPSKF